MKKFSKKLFIIFSLFVLVAVLLNVNLTTEQGIDYRVRTISIPLYLKVLDFFDRHFNYKKLTKEITKVANSDEGKVMAILEWTYNNIKPQPKSLPVIDDHVWNIIIRGYGTNDQSCDVFSTICNYAGLEAFYSWLYTPDRNKRIPMSFVKIGKKWFVFDPSNGVYFTDKESRMTDIEMLKSPGAWSAHFSGQESAIDYALYFPYLEQIPQCAMSEMRRSNLQSPLRRFIFEVKKYVKQ